jgi:hypothetical protein
MPPRGFVAPPIWTDGDLKEQRGIAEELFRSRRREEGPRVYASVYDEVRPVVLKALALTDDLRGLTGEVFLHDPNLWQPLRYFCGPFVSEEDLWTLVGGPKFKQVPAEYAQETANAINDVLDPMRFPWISEGRRPTSDEKEAAILATVTLMANREIATSRRGSASKNQELIVADALREAGYTLDPSRAEITLLDDMQRGTFSKERNVAGAKSDVPVRLHDGRLLALECKVSNGPKNGWKRVNREAGGKAGTWKSYFGTQAVTGVVLSGVFDLSCLASAQKAGLTIFWEHDLSPLASFVNAAI